MTMPPWAPAKGAKTKRLAAARLQQLMYHASIDDDEDFMFKARHAIPDAWNTLEMDLDVQEPKDKVTLYLDRSVARMFRAMGSGYQARINRILATWVQMKIAEKATREMDMLTLLKQAADEKEAVEDDAERREGRKALHEHWAYNEGWTDAAALLTGAAEGKGPFNEP